MTRAAHPDSRPSLRSQPSLARTLQARGFQAACFLAAFFGLFVLVVFFLAIGQGIVRWFQTVPELVQKKNQELITRADFARDREAFFAKALAAIERDMERELRRASTEKAREKIRQDYVRIRERERTKLEAKRQEDIANERFVRPDTSPPALFLHFLTSGPSNDPGETGIRPALVGSILLGLITLAVAVPLGVGAAIYLEEYKQTSWLASIIQVNINNLAGVPSIMFGILATFVFIDLLFHGSRNLLGGGLTLGLLTLPVIIVSTQEAIRAVPVSLRHASIALGATRWQTIWRVVLPSSLPGILTGSILALSRALGEAAPLVFFGALLFQDASPSLFGRFTVLPMQIFNWTQRAGQGYHHAAAVASGVLLVTLLMLNGVAIYLRQRAQRHTRW
jgi:phosphate transport system permease protein